MTGYVRLDSPHRSHDAYLDLGRRLQNLGLPLTIFHQSLDDCWLARWHQENGRQVNPGGKDSLAYHCVNHEKTLWMVRAARAWQPTTIVWLDLGLFHIKAIQPEHVLTYVKRLEESPPIAITAPSCRPVPDVIDDSRVCWTFCGGVIAVPAEHVDWLHRQAVSFAIAAPPTWEVNTWAKIAQKSPDMFDLYKADHNEQLFTGLP